MPGMTRGNVQRTENDCGFQGPALVIQGSTYGGTNLYHRETSAPRSLFSANDTKTISNRAALLYRANRWRGLQRPAVRTLRRSARISLRCGIENQG